MTEMGETILHRWLGNHKDARLLRRLDRGVSAVHHALNWAHSDIRSSGEVRLLRALAQQLHTVFDVGAHDGAWAEEVLRSAPWCEVHCFEVSLHMRHALAARLDDGRAVIAPFGLHAESAVRRLKEYPSASHLSSLADYPHDHAHLWSEVGVEAGDAYADKLGIDVIDLLKIDTDGSEWDVLQGFERRLATGQIGAVQFEYGRVNIVVRRLLADFAQLFEENGYDLFRIRRHCVESVHYSFDLESFFVVNFLAIHRSRRDMLARLA
jgi:FkbM family methyltransferase